MQHLFSNPEYMQILRETQADPAWVSQHEQWRKEAMQENIIQTVTMWLPVALVAIKATQLVRQAPIAWRRLYLAGSACWVVCITLTQWLFEIFRFRAGDVFSIGLNTAAEHAAFHFIILLLAAPLLAPFARALFRWARSPASTT